MDAHADAQRSAELGAQLGIDVVEGEIDGPRRPPRVAATGLNAMVLPEDGEQAVSQKLVGPAAVGMDGGAGRGEELVEDEDYVVGEAALGQLCKVAQVEKHDGQLLLHARRVELLDIRRLRPGT